MKIVLSRKGFDSGYGGVPSPIFPDGQVVSLPIPSGAGMPASMGTTKDFCLGSVMADLSQGRLNGDTLVHIDPDLEASTLSRHQGWRAAFGQVGAAQSHLANQDVGVGDLFLFFGWFQPVERVEGRWQYVAGAPSFHGLFGWLQVGTVINVDEFGGQNTPTWLAEHPHVAHAGRFAGQRNTIYVAADRLQLGRNSVARAAGMFSRWSPALKLTAEGRSRSVWQVPIWFEPCEERPALTYHGHPDRWTRQGRNLYLKSVAKGQEFVLNAAHYPEAVEWASSLIKEHA